MTKGIRTLSNILLLNPHSSFLSISSYPVCFSSWPKNSWKYVLFSPPSFSSLCHDSSAVRAETWRTFSSLGCRLGSEGDGPGVSRVPGLSRILKHVQGCGWAWLLEGQRYKKPLLGCQLPWFSSHTPERTTEKHSGPRGLQCDMHNGQCGRARWGLRPSRFMLWSSVLRGLGRKDSHLVRT